VPPHLRHLHDGKAEISLGQSLSGAYQKFSILYQVEENITLMRDLFDRYRAEVVSEKRQNTQRSNHRSLERLRTALGENFVSAVTPLAIYKYRDLCGRKYSKKYANLDLEVLSHCFTKGIEWGVLPDHPMTNKKVTKFELKGRNRYVEDWELDEWATVASPFLLAYVGLKGATGLRKQDLLSIALRDISDTELTSVNLKTGKKLRFPLYVEDQPTSVKLALDNVLDYYQRIRAHRASKRKPVVMSQWLFHNRTGGCYWSFEEDTASGFDSIWQRHMKKALAGTALEERFTDHDLRAKVGSDLDTDTQAVDLLAHSSPQVTKKHYRRKGSKVTPAQGFFGTSKVHSD
tara:strand:+ start:1951 stop:2988 length:1038 start_codon:yes stop_codon:yes gene_type:complete